MKTTMVLNKTEIDEAVRDYIKKRATSPCKIVGSKPVIKTRQHSDPMDRNRWTTTELEGYEVEIEV